MKHILQENSAVVRALWMALLVAASIAFSFALACATPFAALAAMAALFMRRRDGFVLIAAAWFANQCVGYGFLHFPRTTDSFAWGLMIGLAALAATQAAIVAKTYAKTAIAGGAIAFAAAFVAYEAVLFATGVVASDLSGFSAAIVGYIFWVNALAFIGFLVLQALGRVAGIATSPLHAAG